MSRLAPIAAAALLAAGAAAAQTAPAALPPLPAIPGATAVRIGQTLARPAGKPGTAVDLYAFIGEAGAILEATAAGAGGYGVTIYTPEGAEMLTATGRDLAKLSAVLPKDDIYVLAVTRQDAAKPYKLSLAAEAPDIFLWSFRSFAGYESLQPNGDLGFWTCWVVPGQVLRYHLANGQKATLTVRPGGDGAWDYRPAPGSYSFTTRLDGATFVRTTVSTGRRQTWSLDDPPAARGAYRGYLCD